MSSGSSKGGDTETTIRYAPYLEAAHGGFLNHDGADYPLLSFTDVFNEALNLTIANAGVDRHVSPYRDYVAINQEEGFFGIKEDDPTSTYELKNFPSLWDIFGKFMAGLDVHDLWGQVYEDVIRGPEIEAAVSAHSRTLQDQIDTVTLPPFLAGMRDINAVQSSAFVIGKAIIEETHVREVNKFAGDIRLRALELSVTQWGKHLEWSQSVVNVYAELMKLYYTARMDIDRVNLEYDAKDSLWNINLFEYARSMIGAMAGAAAAPIANEPSQLSKAVGGALSGAAAGFKAGGWAGAGIGAAFGAASSFL